MAFIGALGGATGAIALGSAKNFDSMMFISGVLVFVVIMPISFLIGRWIGRRVVTLGVLVTVAVVVLPRLILAIGDKTFVPPEQGRANASERDDNVRRAIGAFVLGVLSLGLFALLGYWRGTRQRLSSYLSYILGRVSSDTRDAIVALAYDEAIKAEKANHRVAA